jgi:hypothetical protein
VPYFWQLDDAPTYVLAVPAWQAAARQLSAAKGVGLADNARLFALLNMGVANTFITDWDAKFTYKFWRPVTAIRNGVPVARLVGIEGGVVSGCSTSNHPALKRRTGDHAHGKQYHEV